MCNLINTHTHIHTHTHSHNRKKTRRPSETVASCEGPKPRDERRGTESGRGEERRRGARNLKRAIHGMRETGETWAEIGRNVDKKVLVR